MCHIGTWSTRYYMTTAEKVWRSKVKKIWFVECHKMTLGKSPLCRVPGHMALGKEFFKKLKNPSLPSASPGALSKFFLKKTLFAECQAR